MINVMPLGNSVMVYNNIDELNMEVWTFDVENINEFKFCRYLKMRRQSSNETFCTVSSWIDSIPDRACKRKPEIKDEIKDALRSYATESIEVS